MERDELKDRIMALLTNEEGGMKASQVEAWLADTHGVDVSRRTVQMALRELADEGELRRERVSDGSRGAPPYYYFLQAGEDTAEDQSGTDDVADTAEESEGEIVLESSVEAVRGEVSPPDEDADQQDLLMDIAKSHLEESDYVQDIKAAAPELAREDPRDLLVEMLDWSVETINAHGRQLYRYHQNGHLRQFSDERETLEGFVRWTERYFQGLLRLDEMRDDSGGTVEVLHIPSVGEFYDGIEDEEELPMAKYDEDAIRERLSQRVFGDSVVYTWEIEDEGGDAAGTDASMADIPIPSNQPLATQTAFKLFTGAGALERADGRYTDFDFDPESFRRYRHRKAFKEGLLVSGRVHPELGEGQADKAQYAAMDLRQYNENMRVMREKADWRPVGETVDRTTDFSGPDVVYGDGRVFPLVHQISDFKTVNIYGDLVRNEVRHFAEMISLVGDDYRLVDSTFAGVVKRPGISWITPLVFWYIDVKRTDHDPKDEIPQDVYQPRLSDRIIPHLLFVGLAEDGIDLDEDQVFVTFRVLRRFYDMSLEDRDVPPTRIDSDGDERIIDVNDVDEWMDFFEELVEDKSGRGYETLNPEQYKPFALMCANAGVVMCYSAPQSLYAGDLDPSEIELLLPRIEAGVSPPRDAPEELRKALSWFARNPKLDSAHASGDFSSFSDLPVLVPSVIVESDKAAKFASDSMGTDVREELLRLIEDLRDE